MDEARDCYRYLTTSGCLCLASGSQRARGTRTLSLSQSQTLAIGLLFFVFVFFFLPFFFEDSSALPPLLFPFGVFQHSTTGNGNPYFISSGQIAAELDDELWPGHHYY